MKCPYCEKKMVKVFHGEPDDELAIESFENEVIIGNCCDSSYNYQLDLITSTFNIRYSLV